MLTVRVEEMQRGWPRLFSQVAPGSALAPALLLAFSKLRERNLPGRDRHALQPRTTSFVTHRTHKECAYAGPPDPPHLCRMLSHMHRPQAR